MMKASLVNFELRLVSEPNVNRRYSLVGTNSVIWIRPTFIKDNTGKMIYEHDIVAINLEQELLFGRVEWKDNEWVIVYPDDKYTSPLNESLDVTKVVGNMFEDANLFDGKDRGESNE